MENIPLLNFLSRKNRIGKIYNCAVQTVFEVILMAEQFSNGSYNYSYDSSGGGMKNFGSGSVGGPPPPPIVPKYNGLRTAGICLFGSAIIIILAVIIFNISGGTVGSVNYQIPSGGRLEGQYVNDDDIPTAPNVFPDENGPQISVWGKGTDKKLSASEVYQNVSPSIVCITSYEGGKDYVLDAIGEGSGIILTEDGYIATNSHVVDDSKATGVMVTLFDEREFLGTVIGVDVKTDLAVLKIDAEGLTPAKFADSDKASVGQDVFAIGNPGGIDFLNSLTTGTLSAVNRLLSSGYIKYIQTDAAINPGNSGGALVDEYGRVIGMNTAKIVASGYDNMGFAIPSNDIIEIINKLIKYGKVIDRGTLMVSVKDCTLYMSKSNSIPQGVIIYTIQSGSPLKKTQVQENDIITSINDVKVTSSVELIDELKKYKPDDTVKLTLYRVGNGNYSKSYSFDVNVKLVSDSETQNYADIS